MMNIFRNLFTGKDNVTHDLGRWSWAGSFLTLVAGLGVNAWHHALIDLTALAATDLFKAEHFLHLRCELPAPDMMELLEPVVDNPRARMVSLMDHSPGIGQYANMDRYRRMRVREGHKADWIEGRIVELQDQRARMRGPNRRRLLDRVIPLGIVLASHDDNTADEVAENARDGIRISEFPVSMLAASEARRHGMTVIAGAPNLVRGGSHSGNVAAADLVRAGVVDAYASDYVPSSMLEAAFGSVAAAGTTLPQGVAMVTDGPARMCGLHDRGRIEAGLRADLVRVREWDGLAVVRQVWRAGERVV